MKLSFEPGRHRFKCVSCGKCCYPDALSLTPRDHESISGTGEGSDMRENADPPFSHVLDCKGRCRFLDKDTLCRIWERRPAVCAAFPLTFTYAPDGELLVNYIACDGQDAEGGEVVDEAFVEKTMNEIRRGNPTFFEELKARKVREHGLLFPFYTQNELTDFDSKQHARERLAGLFSRIPADERNFRVSCYAFLKGVSDGFQSELARHRARRGKTVLFGDEVEAMVGRVEDRLAASFGGLHDELRASLDLDEKRATGSGICRIAWEGEVKQVALGGELATRTLTGESIAVKVSSVFFRRDFSAGALGKLIRHLSESVARVDLGGFPMDAEISVMLQVLGDHVKNLETFCYMYEGGGSTVSEDTASRVVRDLDTFFVLGGAYAERTRAGTQH